ncbi:MAG: NADH-quinone oxidoreductase subunit J, partial [Sediminibacterium sp.]|nr:NADH-quinone oxidoreductase subunit J [Sediminibacterium sp.]
MSVISKKIFNAAIWLLFCLIGISMVYFWLSFNFVAAIQIMIYVGGIIVIIIFSIFLTQEVDNKMPEIKQNKKIIFGLISCILFAVLAHFIYHANIQPSTQIPQLSMQNIGLNLMDITQPYLIPFEMVGILLLAV